MGQGFTSTALAALMIGVATPVIAQSSDVARRFEIAAGPLDRSLPEFARQSGLQILYPSALVAGRQSPAVNGDLTSEVALTLLLRDSGLTYRQSRPTVFVLVDPSARAEVSGVEAVELDEVVVTGTYLRGADSPSPVTVITQADVARQGRATVAETLAAMPQNFTGAAYEGSANTGADRSGRNIGSATGVNLRGLGADATLVLVNGRRVAGTGSAGDFADISNIPSSAISRADVLLDGASALYGADAVGGVVNIILRSRFEGAETRVRVGGTSDGGSEEFLFSHGGGLSWGSGSIVAAYEYHDRSELQGADRDATADADLRRFGGTDRRLLTASPGNIVRLDAATATYIPLFAIPSGQNGIGLAPGEFLAGRINRTNQLEGQWFLPDQKRQSVFLAARQNLPAGFSLDGDVRYTERDFFLKTSADAGTFTVTAANPYFVSPNGSTSHDIAFSWVNDLGPGVSEGSSESVGGAIGVSGELLGWNVSAYASGAQETTDRRLSNRVQTTFLQEALGARADLPTTTFRTATDGFFNPFGGPAANSATILAHIGSGYANLYRLDLDGPSGIKPLLPMEEDAGYTMGPFSPDGSQLVVYRLQGHVFRLGIVDLRTGVVAWSDLSPESGAWGRSVQWISDNELLVLGMPDGDLPPRLAIQIVTQTRLPDLWARAARGQSAFVSAGHGAPEEIRESRTLWRVNADTGAATVLTDGDFLDFEASPDGSHVAVLKDGPLAAPPGLDASTEFRRARSLRLVNTRTGSWVDPPEAVDISTSLLG